MNAYTPGTGKAQVPQATAELARIRALPRRAWTDADAAQAVQALTAHLRKPGGDMILRPIQAIALLEIGLAKGGFLPIRVAGGKTLISLLAPTVLGAERPLLVVPAKLQEKTRRAWKALAYHWKIHPSIRIISYELLGRVQARELLETWRPDCIVADEAHKLKSREAGVTKRVRWYLDANPSVRYVDMSGSITKRSIKDYAHRAGWALRGSSPVPLDHRDLVTWSGVLDEQPGAWRNPDPEPPDPGALVYLGPGESIRDVFRARCHDTLGWVATRESELSIPIVGEIVKLDVPRAVSEALTHLRKTWSSPEPHAARVFACPGPGACSGDAEYEYAPEVWAHARQIALGFWYQWDPQPPPVWKARRKAWGQWVRHLLEHSRRNLATPLDAANAVDQGYYPEAERALAEWREVRDTFKPDSRPVWFDTFALDWCKERLSEDPCLLWTEHRAFAERLAQETGVPFYSSGGCDARGRSILDHDPAAPAICSVRAIGEGFDLQKFSRNVVASAPTGGREWEQLLGRTLREGQAADEITLTVLSTCLEHDGALEQARADAAYIESTTGQRQILLTVDWA